MQISVIYILSQVLVVIYYLLVISTYQLKDRSKILKINLVSLIVMGISYACLDAYSGIAMVFLGIIRNVMFYLDENSNTRSDKITKKNVIELILLIILSIVLSIFTYEGFWSLMSVVATVTYTISIWQKNTKVYKILGIPIGIAGITYNIYIKSILGIIFESFSFISAIIGYLREHTESRIPQQFVNLK